MEQVVYAGKSAIREELLIKHKEIHDVKIVSPFDPSRDTKFIIYVTQYEEYIRYNILQTLRDLLPVGIHPRLLFYTCIVDHTPSRDWRM
jgi:hypothetical protein